MAGAAVFRRKEGLGEESRSVGRGFLEDAGLARVFKDGRTREGVPAIQGDVTKGTKAGWRQQQP